jgi:sirohydrochlorin cobaltochelatase
VVVVPFFISDGLHSYEDIPSLLGIDGQSEGPHQLHGRSLFYSTAIGTDSRFADVIIEQARAFNQRKQVLQSVS